MHRKNNDICSSGVQQCYMYLTHRLHSRKSVINNINDDYIPFRRATSWALLLCMLASVISNTCVFPSASQNVCCETGLQITSNTKAIACLIFTLQHSFLDLPSDLQLMMHKESFPLCPIHVAMHISLINTNTCILYYLSEASTSRGQ